MAQETVKGDGWAVSSLDAMGQGPGFRKVRRELDVEAFGVNAIVLPGGYDTGAHYHEEQDELYLVLRGTIEIALGADESDRFTLEEGDLAHVNAHTVRHIRNAGEDEAVYFIVGGKDGYVGRDGRQAGGEELVPPGQR